jgi:hypothetical protein
MGVGYDAVIWSRRCEDTTSKPDWTAAVDRERLVGAAAATVFGVDMVKEVNEWRRPVGVVERAVSVVFLVER